ncbi:hypothetical protein B0T10DRAFT_576906 [Thelonectria olida]|uniref:HNH nuclease domain-containing protein n=1 Tax=Thelonectria olida TaxID=1576542 RepID=A0A9P8VZK6_9HYPO|nr:hypothetical protein B0T10DRAFT_576906 [Thelonectria olida]
MGRKSKASRKRANRTKQRSSEEEERSPAAPEAQEPKTPRERGGRAKQGADEELPSATPEVKTQRKLASSDEIGPDPICASPDLPKTPLKQATPAKHESPVDQSISASPTFSASIMKKMAPTKYQREVGKGKAKLETSKRSFSNLSQESNAAVREVKFSRKFDHDSAALESFIANEVRKKIDAIVKVIQDTLDLTNEHIRLLNADYHEGESDIKTDEYRENMERLELEAITSRINLAVLHGQKNQFIGEYIDDMRSRLGQQQTDDWAYIDLLISRYSAPKHAKLTIFKSRDEDAQNRFRNDVMSAYGAERPSGGERLAWCCIQGAWYFSEDVRAAHIVPYNTGEPNAQYLFGKPDSSQKNGHLMSVRNGIPMLASYEKRFDNGSMTLVPIPGTNDIKVVNFRALNLQDMTEPCGEMQLHGKILKFNNDFRPANRYLYFHYATTLLRRQRHEVPGWWRGFKEYGSHEVWATPGRYLRQSSLLTLARRIGHLAPDEAEAFASPQGVARDGGGALEFEKDDDESRVQSLETTITMRPGPSWLKSPLVRKKMGSNEAWELPHRAGGHSSERSQLEEYRVNEEDEEDDEDDEDGPWLQLP